MAIPHGSKAKAYINGYDLTAYFTALNVDGVADVAEVTTLGKTAKEYVVGLKDATFSLEGNWDGAAAAVDEVLQAALGASSAIVNFLPEGDGFGKVAYGADAIETAYSVSTPIEDAGKVTASGQVRSGGMERGLVHHPLQAEVAGVNHASQDNLASSANGGTGFLQADGAGSSGTTVWKIQHSTDNISFPDLITFATVTNNTRTKERKIVSGTVNRYTRAANDLTTNGAKVFVSFGRG